MSQLRARIEAQKYMKAEQRDELQKLMIPYIRVRKDVGKWESKYDLLVQTMKVLKMVGRLYGVEDAASRYEVDLGRLMRPYLATQIAMLKEMEDALEVHKKCRICSRAADGRVVVAPVADSISFDDLFKDDGVCSVDVSELSRTCRVKRVELMPSKSGVTVPSLLIAEEFKDIVMEPIESTRPLPSRFNQ